MRNNVLVAQSGGPSPVINASLQGVIDACLSYPEGWPEIELENGLQRFARLNIRFIDKVLPYYCPENF